MSEEPHEPKTPSKWEDPAVPAGNAPPMSKWPFGLALTAWAVWVAFLAAIRFDIL